MEGNKIKIFIRANLCKPEKIFAIHLIVIFKIMIKFITLEKLLILILSSKIIMDFQTCFNRTFDKIALVLKLFKKKKFQFRLVQKINLFN